MPRLVVLLVALCVADLAMAQRLAVRGTIGRSSSDMNWVYENGLGSSANQSRDAFYPAVGVRRRVSRRFSLEADLQVAPKGYDRTSPTMHSTFLEVPVLLLWEWSGAVRPTQWYLGAGLAPAVMLQCRRFFVGNIGPHEDGCGEATYGGLELEAFRRWDVAQEWRFGVRRGVGRGRVVANLRVSSSLTDQQPGQESREVTTKHFVMGWSLGYELIVK